MVRVIVTKNKDTRAMCVKEFVTMQEALIFAGRVTNDYKLSSFSISEFIIRCLIKD